MCAKTAPAADDQVVVSHNQADRRFITAIERAGECRIKTAPAIGGLRIPWQLYPKESVDKHDEGRVTFELVLDANWCVRKAAIVKSSGFWRLDNVTLAYLMTVRYTPKPETIKQKEGEPTVILSIGWGASQGKH
jgi:outer membrane biosynthesis protein TonB